MTTATTIAPAGSQRMRALRRANEVRLARAALKRRVRDGELSVTEVVLRCPWETDTMTVAELLSTQHGWGSEGARKLLAQVQMSEAKTVGSMTARQRRVLAVLLSSMSQAKARTP